MVEQDTALLRVEGLCTYFYTRRGEGKAVDGVSFQVRRGETLGIVGESGCGKSVTALSILRLVPKPAGHIVSGRIMFDGENLLELSEEDMREYRGQRLSMILQDPMTALNPVFTLENQIAEPMYVHQGKRGKALVERVIELLRLVRIPAPETRCSDFPHQFSGGMRQRAVGAIVLSCDPSLIICDEPTTSLDVTIQAQYLRLLKDIQQEKGVALIFITHDFGIVSKVCDKVVVMYAGRIVEAATVRQLFLKPSHPYTEGLLDSVPTLARRLDRLPSIEGQPPSIYELPQGCHFSPRCRYVMDRCQEEYPPEFTVEDGHVARCWRLAE